MVSRLQDAVIKLAHADPTLRSALLAAVTDAQSPTAERKIRTASRTKPVLIAWPRDIWEKQAPNLLKVATPTTFPEIHGMVFPDDLFTALWYEDKDGNRLPMPDPDGGCDTPDGAESQHTQFALELRHGILVADEDGNYKDIGSGGSMYPNDLVTAMVRSGDWDVEGAIYVAGQACGRCLNVLCHHYDLDDSFAFGSPEYWETNTCCQMCVPVAGDPHPNSDDDYDLYRMWTDQQEREG